MKNLFRLSVVIALLTTSLFAQLSGTKTVGSGGNYATIAAAIADLNAVGVNGAVIFSLTDATYNETGANLYINVTTNAPTASNTVTFKPAAGVSPTINITGCSNSGTNNYGGFVIGNTSYITIDGSNTGGGTTKDLTFVLNDGTNGRYIIFIVGNSDFITVKNTILRGQAYYTSANASNQTAAINVIGQSTVAADNLTVQNNYIADSGVLPWYGVWVQGYTTAPIVFATTAVVKDNIINDYATGVYLFCVGSSLTTSEVGNNKISSPNTAATFNVFGIYLRTCAGTNNVYNNKIITLKLNNATTSVIFGIQTTTSRQGTITNIYNNFIGDFYNIANASTSGGANGIYVGSSTDTGTYSIYYNTISIGALPIPSTSGFIAGIRIGSSPTLVTVKNNIIVDSTNASNAYGIYSGTTAIVSNYNNISVPTVNGNVGYYSATAQKSLANWQSASSQDANSKSVAVNFASSTDLHLTGGSLGNTNLIAVTGLGVGTDIDGETRNASTPYMGADENISTLLPVELVSFKGSSTKRGVELAWTTATETNNMGFEVERLESNKQWAKIGFVEGNGTTNSSHAYTFVDVPANTGTVSYRLKQIDREGSFVYSQSVEILVGSVITFYALVGNYPNPFNPETVIKYQVPASSLVTLKVFDILGKEVATLVNQIQPAGTHAVSFNASHLPSGLYFYSMQANGFLQTKKMMLVK